MFADERKAKIAELLKKRPSVTTSELMELFQVSVETIRRDLEALEGAGLLKRVHGGAISVGKLQNYTSLAGRSAEHQPEKQQLARAACSFVREGDYIALDTGSTAHALAALLDDPFRELTVLTHSLDIAWMLSGKTHIRVILAGGFYLPREKCFCGHLTLDAIRQFHVSGCFLTPAAVSPDSGISDHVQELIPVQRALPEISDQTYILADSSKFGVCAPMKICEFDPDFVYITDSGLSGGMLEACRNTSSNIVLV